ncbi:hypothetical protein FVE85_6805 [Porphyridium purpureum]|uniref:ABC3 transporter permease C-terminal domain-containing protein n=1 Tax=Porphyridium purpureum TaxID=35688 RepID=A0A5J4Z7Z0_PORPP|nr:hypothetical protein FVE85_6805 [Porphyridium purpureum]|eukprot:POR2321..scf295_1
MAPLSRIGSWARLARLVLRQACVHLWANRLMSTLGFLSVLLIVLMLALFTGITEYSSIVTSRLVELEQGAIDLHVRSGYLLNYSLAASVWNDDPGGHSARFESSTVVVARDNRDGQEQDNEQRSICDIVQDAEQAELFPLLPASLLALKFRREREIGLGGGWSEALDPPPGSALVSQNLAFALGLARNDSMAIYVNLVSVEMTFLGRLSTKETKARGGLRCLGALELKVHDFIPTRLSGKLGKTSGEDVDLIIEYDSMLSVLLAASNLNETERAALPSSFDELATDILLNLPSPRSEYQSADFKQVQASILDFSLRAMLPFRYMDLVPRLPVLSGLENLQFISLFLNLLALLVLVVFMVLSYVILFSLFQFSVEKQRAEAGVYRLVGMRRAGVLCMVLVESFILCIPAWALGLVAAQGLFIPATQFLSNTIDADIPSRLPGRAFLFGSLVGLVMPCIAAILPLRAALAISPSEAFLQRQSAASSGVTVTVQRDEHNVPLPLVGISLLGILYGFAVYYLFPRALLLNDLELLLGVFLLLLLSILFGLALLFVNLDLLSLKVCYFFFFFWESRVVKNLARMSMISNRLRNRKTFAMYNIAVALIVYLNVIALLQINVFENVTKQQYGAELQVISSGDRNPNAFQACKEQYERLADLEVVQKVSWVGAALRDEGSGSRYSLENLGHVLTAPARIHPVLPGFGDTVYEQFFRVTERAEHGFDDMNENRGRVALSVTEILYSAPFSDGIIVHDSVRAALGLEGTQSEFLVKTQAAAPFIRARAAAFVSLFTGFEASSFASEQPALVSFPAAVRLSNEASSFESLPLVRFVLRTIPLDRVSDTQYAELRAQLLGIPCSASLEVWEFRSTLDTLSDTRTFLNLGFLGVSVFAMLICSFSLVSSMLASVVEQSKELAVLRALGVRGFQLFRVKSGEAMALLFTSSMYGVLSGWLVALAQALQQNLFLGLPTELLFPWIPVLVILGFSVVTAMVAGLATSVYGKHKMLQELRAM